ncbi:MAG TPA: TlpA disulfide reductase family protein [Jatrophihabitantaceae bacterium]|jgi:peroxiredoxin
MKRPIRLVALAALAASASLLLAACTGKDAVNQTAGGQFRFVSGTTLGKTYPVGSRKLAGDFTADLINGGTITLRQQAGKVVVINFWATWCGPCTTETPQLDAMYRQVKAQGVQVIGIDTKDSRNEAQAFIKDNGITFPIAFDEPGATAIALGRIPALSLPFTVLVDKKQRIAAVYLSRLTPADLEPVLTQLETET